MQQFSTLPRITYTLNGTSYEVSDRTQGLPGIHLVTELESGQVFYRTKWKGDITFVGDDFRILWNVAQKTCCQTIPIALHRMGQSCDSSAPYWKGVFNLSDLKFDISGCSAKLTQVPRPDDGYQTLLENWEKEFNWLQIDVVQSVYSYDRRTLYRRARTLVRLLAGMTNLTLKDTTASSLIANVGPDTISTFLEAAINPVTRVENTLLNALCIQASDFITPGNLNNYPPVDYAKKAMISLKTIADDLKALFNLYPYIDPATSKLRWEHLSFFPGLTYDLPAVTYSIPDTDPVWKGKKTVSTDPTGLYGIYKLSIEPNVSLTTATPEATNADGDLATQVQVTNQATSYQPTPANQIPATQVYPFNSGSIEFTDPCVTRLPGEKPLSQEVTVSTFCTSVFMARESPMSVDVKSWIFLVASSTSLEPGNAIPQIPLYILDASAYPAENGALSASILLRDFHRHNQPFASGITNKDEPYLPKGIPRGMLSIAPVRRLGTVTIPYCCGDDPVRFAGYIETWLASDGVLVSADYEVANQLLTLELAHPAPCQVPHPGAYDPNSGTPGNCPARGTYLRVEVHFLYGGPDPISGLSFPCSVETKTYYADGQCGEYSTSDYALTGAC